MMSFTRRAAIAALALTSAALFAADKPNFTGEWKLNKAKSDLGMMADRMPETFVVKISHEDPTITIAQPGMGGRAQENKLSTDGKESVMKRETPNGEVTIKSTAKWDKDALAVKTNMSFSQGEMEQSDKWTLSEDKKVLTIQRKMSSPMGEMEMKQVLEKQ